MTAFDWPALLSQWVPGDPYQPEPGTEEMYRVKFAVAKRLEPASILEIGVRAGYSALAFLQACPRAQYLGLDADEGEYGGVTGYMAEARARLEPYNAVVMRCNTQERPVDPEVLSVMQGYELVHVDGDHSYHGCLRDITLAVHCGARWILVDDYDFIPAVRQACDVAARGLAAEWTVEHVSDGGYRGNLLFSRKAAP